MNVEFLERTYNEIRTLAGFLLRMTAKLGGFRVMCRLYGLPTAQKVPYQVRFQEEIWLTQYSKCVNAVENTEAHPALALKMHIQELCCG